MVASVGGDQKNNLKTIAIIGAGFSGAALAISLLYQSKRIPLRILLIDKIARMGRGLAYRTWDDNHVLNVPAGNMSALPDKPLDFLEYCQNIDPAFTTSSFASRRLFGDYVEYTLDKFVKSSAATLEKIPFEVMGVDADSKGVTIEFNERQSIRADYVVLAFGQLAPVQPSFIASLPESQRNHFFINNPWDAKALDDIHIQDPILIVGAGHTAIDVLFNLTSLTDERKVYLLSRHGLLSQPHRPQGKTPVSAKFPEFLDKVPATIRHYYHAIRKEIKQAALQGMDWRDVIGPLRPHTSDIWHRLPQKERERFLRHVAPYWSIHRHRLSPSAYTRVINMLERGQIEVIAGQINTLSVNDSALEVVIRQRGQNGLRSLHVKKLINCTGPNYDITRAANPLVKQLVSSGQIVPDKNRIGLEVTDGYKTINATGEESERLFYIGPMLRAQHWEAIAVPELRVHASKLGGILLSK